MSKPVIARTNTLEQWRLHTNKISDNVGNPESVYVSDIPNNTGVVYSNSSDTYNHPVDEVNALEFAVNNLNNRKVKRTGDTISGHLNVLSNFAAQANATIGTEGQGHTLTIKSAITNDGTGNATISPTGTVTIGPTSTTTLGTAGQTTTMRGNISAITSNQTITLSPTGSGTVTVSPASAGNINNMNMGATTRGTGAFTTLAANGAVTMTANITASSTTTGTLVITGGLGVSGNFYVGGSFATDNLSSASTNTNLSLSGNGTGIVAVNDDLSVVGSITSSTGDLILSSGGDVIQTIISGVAASTANVFATTNTVTLNVGDNADVNIGNVSKTTTVRGATTLSGNLTQSGAGTISTGTGNISLNGNIITAIKMADGANLNNEYYTVRSTTATVSLTSILSFSATTYASAEIIVQVWNATTSTRQFSKLLLTYNGTDTSVTEYGTVIAGSSQLVTFSSDINTGNIRLLVTPTSSNSMVYRISVNRFIS